MHRFRHRTFGTITTHDDPNWADRHPQYEPVVEPDLTTMTKDQLVRRAQRRGLPIHGTKAELVERLER